MSKCYASAVLAIAAAEIGYHYTLSLHDALPINRKSVV